MENTCVAVASSKTFVKFASKLTVKIKTRNMLLHQKILQGKYKREAISNIHEFYEFQNGHSIREQYIKFPLLLF